MDRGRATRDLDAVFEPTSVIYEAAATLAERGPAARLAPKTSLLLRELLGDDL